MVEKDERHGAADFAIESKRAPADLKHIFAEVEFVEFHRREPFQTTMLEDILKRCGVSGQKQLSRSVSGIESLAELAAETGESVENLVSYTEADLDELAREKQLGVAQRNKVLKEANKAASVLKIRPDPTLRQSMSSPRQAQPAVSNVIIASIADDTHDLHSVANPAHDHPRAVPAHTVHVETFESENQSKFKRST